MTGRLPNPLMKRLRQLTSLTAEELTVVEDLCRQVRGVPAHQMIASEGAVPNSLHVLLDGWAARQKIRRDGSRQFSAILIPGDICDIDALHLARYDYGVVAMTDCKVAVVDRAQLLDVYEREPNIARVLTWLAFVDNAMLTAWITMLGRARARERISHLFCELKTRLEIVDLAEKDRFDLPLTQEEIADTVGLTSVHVNRMLRQMKDEGLVRNGTNRRLMIVDESQLERISSFTPSYLHVEGMRR